MQTRWKDAELRALRTQMQPHFLFNTLHSISSLVHHDVLAADDMIADLSLMLRRSLDQSADSLVSLDDELEIVSAYLRIQQRRFGDRLTWDCKVPAEIRQAAIPSLLLQTLVENSVRHGLSNQALPGCIEIRAALRGNDISIEVADNGVGFPTPLVEGLGISNSRERLQHLFGEEAELTIADREPRGASVTMKFPLRIMQKRKEPADGNQDPDCGRRAAGAKPRPVASR
jgi:LytS/YehU family sensor histidine kinase